MCFFNPIQDYLECLHHRKEIGAASVSLPFLPLLSFSLSTLALNHANFMLAFAASTTPSEKLVCAQTLENLRSKYRMNTARINTVLAEAKRQEDAAAGNSPAPAAH